MMIFLIFRLMITGKNLYEHASVSAEAPLPDPGVTTMIGGKRMMMMMMVGS